MHLKWYFHMLSEIESRQISRKSIWEQYSSLKLILSEIYSPSNESPWISKSFLNIIKTFTSFKLYYSIWHLFWFFIYFKFGTFLLSGFVYCLFICLFIYFHPYWDLNLRPQVESKSKSYITKLHSYSQVV